MATWELCTQTVREVFEEEVTRLGGELKGVVDDGLRLLARSVFPRRVEVKREDEIQGGVAVRCTESAISVYPYTLRKVCRNGAVMICSSDSWRIDALEVRSTEHVLVELREAIEACASGRALDESVREMRSASADLALTAMSHFVRSQLARRWMGEILSRLVREPDQSRFSLMNAVTSLARDTADPDVRWGLEELGGAIAAWRPEPTPRTPLLRQRKSMAGAGV
jgi:hypothetical protein